MTDLSPAAVVAKFGELTGIKFRFMPHSVQRQASAFVTHKFTIADLELVIAWTRRQIARGENGFSPASLQWRVIFGEHGSNDEFAKFQERLGLAEETRKRGWRPKLSTESAPHVPPEKTVAAPDSAEQERISHAAREHARKFREQMAGGHQ